MSPRETGAETGSRPHTASRQTSDIRNEIVDWLRDAYAMERGLESALQKHANNEDLSGPIRQRAATHLEETRRHAEEVKSTLQSLGSDTSALKTGTGILTQAAKGLGTMFARDERIKDLLDAYAMEHMEIASYIALAAAAQRAGLPQVVAMCQRILPDERRMAQALEQTLPDEVTAYLFETQAEAA